MWWIEAISTSVEDEAEEEDNEAEDGPEHGVESRSAGDVAM